MNRISFGASTVATKKTVAALEAVKFTTNGNSIISIEFSKLTISRVLNSKW